MPLKKLLGLTKCAISDEEIMKRIAKAQSENCGTVEFVFGDRRVTLNIKQLDSMGIMHGNYYAK
jgi:hypothetical protein